MLSLDPKGTHTTSIAPFPPPSHPATASPKAERAAKGLSSSATPKAPRAALHVYLLRKGLGVWLRREDLGIGRVAGGRHPACTPAGVLDPLMLPHFAMQEQCMHTWNLQRQ